MSNMPLLHYEQLLAWFGELCAAGALLGCLYLITASVLALRFTRGRKAQRPAASPVTIVKPLRGAEPRLFGRLSSFCIQNYPAPMQLVFGTQETADPPLQVIARLEAAF